MKRKKEFTPEEVDVLKEELKEKKQELGRVLAEKEQIILDSVDHFEEAYFLKCETKIRELKREIRKLEGKLYQAVATEKGRKLRTIELGSTCFVKVIEERTEQEVVLWLIILGPNLIEIINEEVLWSIITGPQAIKVFNVEDVWTRVTGPELIETNNGLISYRSVLCKTPLAKALIGATEGDVRVYDTKDNTFLLEVKTCYKKNK